MIDTPNPDHTFFRESQNVSSRDVLLALAKGQSVLARKVRNEP